MPRSVDGSEIVERAVDDRANLRPIPDEGRPAASQEAYDEARCCDYDCSSLAHSSFSPRVYAEHWA